MSSGLGHGRAVVGAVGAEGAGMSYAAAGDGRCLVQLPVVPGSVMRVRSSSASST